MVFRTEPNGVLRFGESSRARVVRDGVETDVGFFIQYHNGAAVRAYLEHEVLEWEALDNIGTRPEFIPNLNTLHDGHTVTV